MAKKKTFAVTVKITREVTLFVDARRAGGAEEAVKTHDFTGAWENPWAYQDDTPAPTRFDPRTMEIIDVRPVS